MQGKMSLIQMSLDICYDILNTINMNASVGVVQVKSHSAPKSKVRRTSTWKQTKKKISEENGVDGKNYGVAICDLLVQNPP